MTPNRHVITPRTYVTNMAIMLHVRSIGSSQPAGIDSRPPRVREALSGGAAGPGPACA